MTFPPRLTRNYAAQLAAALGVPDEPRRVPPIERVLPRVRIDLDGCWIWTGSKTTGGYGNLSAGRGTYLYGLRMAASAHSAEAYRRKSGPRAGSVVYCRACRREDRAA